MPKKRSLVIDPREHRIPGDVKLVVSVGKKFSMGSDAASARKALIKYNEDFKKRTAQR